MRFPAYPRLRRAAVAQLLALATVTAWLPSAHAADLYYLGAQYTPGPGFPAPWPTEGSWFDTNLWQNNTLPNFTTNVIFGANQPMPNDNVLHAPHTLHFGNFGYTGTTVIPDGTANVGSMTILSDNWTFDLSSGQNPDFTGTLTPSTGSLRVQTCLALSPGFDQTVSLSVQNGVFNFTSVTLSPSSGQSASLVAQNCTLNITTLGLGLQGGTSLLSLNGNSYLQATEEIIGSTGLASLTQNAGTNSIYNYLKLGYNAGAVGVYTLTGGLLSVSGELVGVDGTGSFTQDGGTHAVSGSLSIGYSLNLSGKGAYTLSNGTLSAPYVYIGAGGPSSSGTFTQTGGTHTVSKLMALASLSGADGSYTLSGGQLRNPSVIVGMRGHAQFVQTGGTHTVTGSICVGSETGSSGTYDFSGGICTIGGSLVLAAAYGSTGVFTLDDGQLSTKTTCVGYAGNGTFSQTSGTHVINGSLSLGYGSPSTGTYHFSGGVLTATEEVLGFLGSASFTQTGGTHTVAGLLSIGSLGFLNLSGGTLQVNGLNNAGSLTLGGSTVISTQGVLDLSMANLRDVSGVTINLAPNSVLGLPAGEFTFGSINNSGGIIFSRGGTMVVPSTAVLQLGYWAPSATVDCAGTLTSSGTLTTGLLLHENTAKATFDTLLADNDISTLTAGSLTFMAVQVGYSASGAFAQTGGTHTPVRLSLGYNAGAAGTYLLSNGVLSTSDTNVGYSGSGSFFQGGGTHTATNVYVGRGATATGNYELTNGLLRTTYTYVGASGSGTMIQTGGTHVLSGTASGLYLGQNAGSAGSYALSAGLLASTTEYIGYTGMGVHSQTGGTHTVSGTLGLGYNAGATGSYILSDGSLTALYEYVGMSGTGTFTQSGGTVESGYLTIAWSQGSTGYYALSNGVLKLNTATVAGSGTGRFSQTGGTHTATVLAVSPNTGVTGVYELSQGLLSVAAERVGLYSGSGTVLQTGGIHDITDYLSIGPNGVVQVTAGTLQVASGLANNGAFVLGGTVTMTAGGLIDLARATFQDLTHVNFTLNANSLMILPPGSSAGDFGSFTNNGGRIAFPGSPVTVPAGTVLSAGGGSCHELLICDGTVTGQATLYGGIQIQDPSASVTADRLETNAASSLAAGQLTLATEYVGYSAPGSFTQTGGTHTTSSKLYLGFNGFTGVYSLVDGLLVSAAETIGCSGSGSGTFTQSGGTHTLSGFGSLTLGGVNSTGTYSLTGGQLVGNSEYLGNGGGGFFVQDGGTHTLSGTLVLGSFASNVGVYTLTDGLLKTSALYVGSSGKGTFTQTGGTHTASVALVLADQSTGSGCYTLSAGQLNGGGMTVGVSGKGTFTQTGGINTLPAGLTLGANSGATGSYSLSNSQLTVTSTTIGKSGSGTFTQSSGTHTLAGTLTLGSNAGATGSYFLSTGQLTTAYEYLGSSGTGTFTQMGGTHSVSNTLYLAAASGSSGVCTLADGQLTTAYEYIGHTGTGRFTQSGGTHSVSGYLYIGNRPGSAGTLVLQGGTIQVSTWFSIGGWGSGTLLMSGGELLAFNGTNGTDLDVGDNDGSAGSMNLSGGTATIGTLYVGKFGKSTGTLTQSGGIIRQTLSGGTDWRIGYSSDSASRGLYVLSGGTLTARSNVLIGSGSSGTVTQTGGILTSTGAITLGASGLGSYTLSGTGCLSAPNFYIGGSAVGSGGSGTMVVSSGTATLANTLKLWNTSYSTSTLTFSGGTLSVGTLDLTQKPAAFSWTGGFLQLTGPTSATLTIPPAGTLGGAGTLTGNLTNNGTLNPGNSPGLFTIQGNYTQAATAKMLLEIGGTAPATYDRLKLTGSGSLTFGGTITVSLLPGYTPALGDSFDFVDWTGTCTNNNAKFDVTKAPLSPNLVWDTSAFFTTGVISIAPPTWSGKTSSDWGTLGNWNTPAVPNSTGQAVVFGQAGARATIDLGTTSRTVGTMTFNSAVSTTLTGSNGRSLVLDNGTSAANITVTGNHSITASLQANSDISFTGTGSLSLGTVTLAAGRSITVAASTVVNTNALAATNGLMATLNGSLKVNSAAASRGTPAIALDIAPGGLTFGTSGSLDITNHDVLLRFSPGMGDEALSNALSWLQSSQITSTSLATNQALACVNNATLATPFTAFDGIALADANQILIKYTWKGDATLDGQIDFNDYLAIDAGYLFGGTDWTHGDFTGDSQVTLADYVAIDAAFLAQNQVLASSMIDLHSQQFGEEYTEALAAAVPEPSSLVLLFLGSLSLLRRRRKGIPVFERGPDTTGLASPERSQRSSES